MTEIIDTLPDTNVQPAEFKRLLGYPRNHVLKGRGRALVNWARDWYAQHGRPWVYARQADSFEIRDGAVCIDGASFASFRLQKTLQQAEAHGVFLVAVSAGIELEQEAQRLWREGKPDEYFFLEVYGSAVVEHLTTMTGARLCAWAEGLGMVVLPHYSPGYSQWNVADQPRLLELVKQGRQHHFPYAVETLESGMLRPKKSLLAVFGVTRRTDLVRRVTELEPCENCAFLSCQYRRVPYRRAIVRPTDEVAKLTSGRRSVRSVLAPPLEQEASYTVHRGALERWAEERLSLIEHEDGAVGATFRYEGTTCSNLGRPIEFDYFVKLGPRDDGYPIRELLCRPAPGDTGHTYMCHYMNNAEHLMVAIEKEKPLLGRPLNDILSWGQPTSGAGCHCAQEDRMHKWRLVFETIHYALVRRQKCEETPVIQEADA
jgi:hypothetical protein